MEYMPIKEACDADVTCESDDWPPCTNKATVIIIDGDYDAHWHSCCQHIPHGAMKRSDAIH